MDNKLYLETEKMSNARSTSYSPFRLDKGTIDELLSHQGLHLLDANTIIENDSDFQGRYRDTQKREIDVKTLNNLLNDSDTFISGASLSETISIISRANPSLYQKLKERLSAKKSKKIINQFDKRLSTDFGDLDGFNNVLDLLESGYGNPTLMRKEEKSALYDEAVTEYISSKSDEERDESVFKYFMAFTLDVAGSVDQGDKPNQQNILFDAYNVAMGLMFSYKCAEQGKSQPIYLTTSDGDVENILVGIEDTLSDIGDDCTHRPYDLRKEVETEQEKELIGYLNDCIMNVVPESKIEYERNMKKK